MTVSFLPQIALLFMLIFARLGTMLMLLPALGESNIPPRIRLSLALLLAMLLYPSLAGRYPGAVPGNFGALIVMFASEFVVGLFIGLSVRLIMAGIQIAGTIMAQQSSLAMAMAFDPTQSQQGVLFANFLTLLAVTLIFATNLHYLVIAALNDSFTLFPPGHWMPVGDLAESAVETVAAAFSIGMRISAPFIVFGLVFYFGLGLLNRLMPQMQIFFIAMPANIFLGIGLLMLLLGTLMTWYMSHIEQVLGRFVVR
ncbi:flagellar biosynthetic protein FliR [Breoghania corrubedonensis]|uniref:Flagellar biosynthetic protein FliR n=1 Tax=Breoghania corrubedonensis TaxID=665038 RepID=A0A2T5VDE3_9HYPH|nr:flagellar biosynthetic protein FliR [Breoghania corrubedonensis]PTW61763.1 flagellar biosynthetic protein FliR [Breoghania corrubedonensis]